MNYGFDYHGVLNLDDSKFRDIAMNLVSEGHQVHVLTGSTKSHWKKESQGLLKIDVHYTHFFSIADHLNELGNINLGDEEKPRYKDDEWNKVKGMYAFYSKLIEHTDDCIEYKKYFPSTCKFNHVVNGVIV